jgi:PadR family transcriptional regulator PadR
MLRFLLPLLSRVQLMAKNDLQGALDLLVLKTLSQLDSMHGYGILTHIRRVTDESLIVEEGSLYPALHRMEQQGWCAPAGRLRSTGAKPSGMRSRAPAGNSWPAARRTGRKSSRAWTRFCVLCEVQ